MGKRGRRRKISVETRKYRLKQRKKDLAAMKEKEQQILAAATAAPDLPAPRVIYPRTEVPKHRLLLPRPQPQPVTLVAAPSSSANSASNGAPADPKMPSVKKIFILGPNSVLYEVLGSPAGVPVTTPVDQNFVIPNLSSPLPVPNLVPLKQVSAEGSSNKQSSSTMDSVLPLNADSPVEEIQVKVELPEFMCGEELPSSESDDEMSGDTNLVCDEKGEGTKSADTSQLLKEEVLSEDEEEEEIFPHIIKKEEITLDDYPLDSPHSQEGDNSNSNFKTEDTQTSTGLTYPRKVSLRPNHANSDDSMYCDECDEDFDDDCPKHGPLNVVDDTPVTANINDKLRAKKTAPFLISIADSDIPGVGSGVWARDVIPARTRFGPFDGKIVSADVCTPHTWLIRLNGKPGYCIDASEPGLSNWMRYVATARRAGEQNLRPFQRFGKLYFRTTRQIEPYEELLLNDDTVQKADFHVFSLKRKQEWDESSVENPGSNSSHSVFVTADLPLKAERDFSDDGEETLKPGSSCSDVLRETSAVNVESSADEEKANFTEENLLSCLICKARFRFEETLNNHLKTHDVANQLECAVCSERFFDESSLEMHQEIHKSDDIRPSSITQLSKRVVIDTRKRRNNRYVCSLCNSWFIYEDSLKDHVQTHMESSLLRCNLCHERFLDSKSLENHVKIHKSAIFTCPVCDKEFQVLASCNRHLATHKKNHKFVEKPYACPFCDEKFAERRDLEEHNKIHPGSKQYVCHVCTEVFIDGETFNEHAAGHKTKNRLFPCTICDEWFANLQQLNGHYRVHRGQKKWECNHCNEWFSRECVLKEHLKTHKQHECPDCDEKFAEISDWIEHRRTHVGVMYICKFCKEIFDHRQDLEKHVLIHKEKEPLQCKFCNKRFTELRFLRKHVRVDHEDRFGLQTWKSWEAWKSQGSQNQSAALSTDTRKTAESITTVTVEVRDGMEGKRKR